MKSNSHTDLFLDLTPDELRQLQIGMMRLEDSTDVVEPDLAWFDMQVAMHAEQERKRLIRDLTGFMVLAVLVVSGLLLVLSTTVQVFLWMQVAGVLFIPLVVIVTRRNRRGLADDW